MENVLSKIQGISENDKLTQYGKNIQGIFLVIMYITVIYLIDNDYI